MEQRGEQGNGVDRKGDSSERGKSGSREQRLVRIKMDKWSTGEQGELERRGHHERKGEEESKVEKGGKVMQS